MAAAPAVSVVIPTYNRLARLQRVLTALSEQTGADVSFEVVVVSDGSDDGTDEYLSAVTTSFDLVSVTQANAGPAAARNRGVDVARGSILLFVDDDVLASPGLVAEHVRTHDSHPGDTVVIGPMLTPADLRLSIWIEWEQAMLYKQYAALARGEYAPTYRQFYTGNASVRRSSIVASGGFDVRYRRAEDVELAYRLGQAGARFVFNDRAIGYHYAERSFGTWLQNAAEYGANEVLFAAEHPSSGRLQDARCEYLGRHALLRGATRACLGRPRLLRTATWQLRNMVRATDRLGMRRLAQFSLSGVYNLRYYSAMADAMGGVDAFFEMIDRPPTVAQ